MNRRVEDEHEHRVYQKAFPPGTPHPCEYLTYHRCDECDALRTAFCGKGWWEIGDEVIVENYDKLPLFTPSAYHYYLPAFLLYALRNFFGDNLVVDFVVDSLAPPNLEPSDRRLRERVAFFSGSQKSLIRDFLTRVLSNSDMSGIHPEATKALSEIWNE